MKRRITKTDVVNMIKTLDTRFKRMKTEQLDIIIDNGFAELLTVLQPFSSSVIMDLEIKYELGELKFDIAIPSDATDVYDLYLEKENLDKDIFDEGSFKERDSNIIWRDGQDSDVVHVDLVYATNKYNQAFNLAVVKYLYVPTHDFDELFIGSDVYLALDAAIGVAAYEFVHDTARSEQKRASMIRKASGVINPYPEDLSEPGRPRIFPVGV